MQLLLCLGKTLSIKSFLQSFTSLLSSECCVNNKQVKLSPQTIASIQKVQVTPNKLFCNFFCCAFFTDSDEAWSTFLLLLVWFDEKIAQNVCTKSYMPASGSVAVACPLGPDWSKADPAWGWAVCCCDIMRTFDWTNLFPPFWRDLSMAGSLESCFPWPFITR